MTRAELIAELEASYAEQRKSNDADLTKRTNEVFEKVPKVAQLRGENASLAAWAMREIMKTPGDSRKIGEEMKRRGMENNRKIREALEAAGYPDDQLELRYACPICRDTGYVGDVPARFCACFEKKLTERMLRDCGVQGESERFDTFDEAFIPDEPLPGKKYTQRYLAKRVKKELEKYAAAFPNVEKPNILLMGEGGLGKTFLLNALSAALIERGFMPVKVNAHRLFEAMRKQHINAAEDDNYMERFINAQILLIDDLGSEPMMKNITVEYLYLLINERWSAGLPTVIATNLNVVQLKERYFERITSRLMDTRLCSAYLLEGRDLRTQH